MEGWIGSLSGYFDGYTYHTGPVSIRIEEGNIVEIIEKPVVDAEIDGRGMTLIPPFTDGHTHMIFAGTRFKELDLKLSGHSYSDILAQGGGIQSTVRATRKATPEILSELVRQRLDVMLSHGTLRVEVKSGYGLSTESELQLLRVLDNIDHPVEVVSTFGAAHVIPPNMDRENYVNTIIDEMLPVVVNEKLATTTDVFCDKGAFTVDETLTIFDASEALGLPVRVHAEELEYRGIAKKSASSYNLLSADHLLFATKDDFETLANHNTVAMFMPLAPFGLFSNQLPSGFGDTDVVIGLGSDFNPNNWAVSMQSAIRMAVYRYRMQPQDAIKAATSGSYQGVTGSDFQKLMIGSPATFLLVASHTLSEFVSKFGQNLIKYVVKNGKIIVTNSHAVV